MGRTDFTELQYFYGSAINLHPYVPYELYRISGPVEYT